MPKTPQNNVYKRSPWLLTVMLAVLPGCAPSGGEGTEAGSTGLIVSTSETPTSGVQDSTAAAGTTTGEQTTSTSESSSDDTGEGAADLTPKTYEADDPRIQYTGRVDFTNPRAPQFSAPGVYVRAAFKGVAAAVQLEDQFVYDVNRNFYEVVVDDAPPFKLAPEKGVTRYELASGLTNGEHVVTVIKRTESALGWTRFGGFEFSGELTDPPPRPDRRMVFIGDSITCGSGNEAADFSPECTQDAYGNPGGWGQPYHNNWMSYGAITARALSADYHITAVSGIGLVRNYSFLYDARPMPDVHDLMFLELQQGSPIWDTQQFVPDVVVVALGTNDFSPGDSPRPPMTVAEFSAAYLEFVATLRADYPDAHIVCVSSPMLGDGYPTPTDKYLTDQKAALAEVESQMHASGDLKVHKFYTTKLYGEGCGTHPSVAQHSAMAAELAAFLAPTVGW